MVQIETVEEAETRKQRIKRKFEEAGCEAKVELGITPVRTSVQYAPSLYILALAVSLTLGLGLGLASPSLSLFPSTYALVAACPADAIYHDLVHCGRAAFGRRRTSSITWRVAYCRRWPRLRCTPQSRWPAS